LSPARVSARQGKSKPARTTFAAKPVTLPTFAFYGHAPVVYRDGALIIGQPRKSRP
jgi:hypothetical protein